MSKHKEEKTIVDTIFSGGQSGVDRAALDVALAHAIPCGGWCPKGRIAEDGNINLLYPLQETPSANYEQRTEWNVRDSDGTLVLTKGKPDGGTAFTIRVCQKYGKPFCVIDLNDDHQKNSAMQFLVDHHVSILNIAGPRESKIPGIYSLAKEFLRDLLA
jgi:hypothetical protein